MANILQQQDLLKGLPDARLAMLLQQPTGDIPPFLVAAEAQRRQTIRQQFAGSENNESVVDSLTRQMVPQNVNAPSPSQTPPVPATPQMQGVMALQQQQMAQQAAMQAQQAPQQMRAGGQVRRFAEGTLVTPRRTTVPSRVGGQGYLPGEEPSQMGFIPRVLDWVSPGLDTFTQNMRDYGINDRPPPTFTPPSTMTLAPAESQRASSLSPKPIDPGTKDTSPENQEKADTAPRPGETPDEFRARLAGMLEPTEPSGWEKAQKWFAMSEQFLDPSKTTMQSIAGAGRAFAEGASAEAERKRQERIDYEKGMLEYDWKERDYQRGIAASSAEMKRDAYKFYAEVNSGNLKAVSELMNKVSSDKNKYIAAKYPPDLEGKVVIDPNDPQIKAYDDQLDEFQTLIQQSMGGQQNALGGYGKMTGTDPGFLMLDPATKTIKRVGG